MQLYNVGPDRFDESDFDNILRDHEYKWIVVYYLHYGPEGEGELLALGMDGVLTFKALGHCSCFGPLDDWDYQCEKITIEEFLRPKDSIHDLSFRKELEEKVRSLLVE